MNRNHWAMLGVVVVVAAVVAAGAVAWRTWMPREYETAISFCPVGVERADVVMYHRSALDGHVEKVTRTQQECRPGLATAVDSGDHPSEPLGELPMTVIVARAGDKTQTTWLYQLPGAAGFFVQQEGASGSREDRTWDLPLDDKPTTVDPASLPAAPQ